MPALPWIRTGSLRNAIHARYAESSAELYGIHPEAFQQLVTAIVQRHAPHQPLREQIALVNALHIAELVLARACSAGHDAAWQHFLAHYRPELLRAACHIARDDAAGRELADSLYADLYGLPRSDGKRISKFDYYTGRGSLAGWLRTVLAQQHIDRCRAGARNVSLEAHIEQGGAFASPPPPPPPPDTQPVAAAVAAALAQCSPHQRFLLAAYFLDGRTLAQLARQLGVHESTISRQLNRLTAHLRKRVRRHLVAAGLTRAQCDELLAQLDVRDLDIDVTATLRQEKEIGTFQ